MQIKIIRKYGMKIKIREWKVLLRNQWLIFISMFFALGYSLSKIYKIITQYYDLLLKYNQYLLWAIIIIITLNTIFKNKYPFRQHPANMIFFSAKDYKQLFIVRDFIKKGFIFGLISILYGIVFRKLQYESILLVLALWNIFFTSLIVRYLKFNKLMLNRERILYVINTLCIFIAILLSYKIGLIIVLMNLISSYLLFKVVLEKPVNFDLVYGAIYYDNKVQYLGRHMIFVDMQEITREGIAQKTRSKSFRNELTRENAIFEKSLLAFKRIDLSLTILLIIIPLLLTIMYSIGLFQYIPILNKSDISQTFIYFSIAICVTNLYRLFTEQYKLLLTKGGQGMFLPFSDGEIFRNFCKLLIPTVTIFVFLVGVILKRSIPIILIVISLYNIFLSICMYFSARMKRDYIDTIVGIISVFFAILLGG